MSEHAIETKDLCKRFRNGVVALTGLGLTVPGGVVYGLLGRNGAGKTTALRVLMGLLKPSAGSALVLGEPMWGATKEQLYDVTYVS